MLREGDEVANDGEVKEDVGEGEVGVDDCDTATDEVDDDVES